MSNLLKLWAALAAWSAGKKTYLLAAVVVVTVVVLVFLGRLTPETAMAIALIALAGFAATFRSALAAHLPQAVKFLGDVAVVGAAVRTHNTATLESASLAAAEDGAALAQQLQPAAEGAAKS